MFRSFGVVALVAALVGCGPMQSAENAPRDVGAERSRIVGGTETQGYPQVVGLALYGPESKRWRVFCTGTLIGPSTILTAGHCIEALGYDLVGSDGTTHYVRQYGALFHWVDDTEENDSYWPDGSGGTILPENRVHRVVKVIRQKHHPNYCGKSCGYKNDVGVMELEAPVTDVAVAPWNPSYDLPPSLVGTNVHHVGFGLNYKDVANDLNSRGAGVKREGNYPITGVLSTDIKSNSNPSDPVVQTCNGDSGGPAFVKLGTDAFETVVAVVSRGPEDCATYGLDTRTDAFGSWLSPTIASWEGKSCDADGFCRLGCTDGSGAPVTDPDCRAAGESCTDDGQCPGRVCNSDRQHVESYCSSHCASDGDCTTGMTCYQSVCRWVQQPEIPFGGACNPDQFCVLGATCMGPPGEQPHCAVDCTDTGTCPYPKTQTCVDASNGRKFCSPPTPPVIFPAQAAVGGENLGCSTSGLGPVGMFGALALVLLALSRRPVRVAVRARRRQ